MNLPFRRRQVALLAALSPGLLLATSVVATQFPVRRRRWCSSASFDQGVGGDPTSGLGPLADLTGGMHLADTNDIATATAKANDDRGRYYLLGYSSGEGVDPEKARVTVRVGRPGLHVRARTRIGRQEVPR